MFHNFYICSSLLSTILDYPVNSNPISSNTKVSNKAFATKLSNPCYITDENILESVDTQSINLRTTLLQVIAKISLANETAEAILKEEDFRAMLCSLVFPAADNIPLAQDLSNNITVEVVRLFYTSLVNHTAYVFFIFEQIEKCTSSEQVAPVLRNETGILALQMKEVMCSFRNLAIALPDSANDPMKDAHKQIFNEELIDIPVCARLILYTCLKLQNILKLLTELLSYLRTMGASQ